MGNSMVITVRYFAAIREARGLASESVAPDDGVATVGDLQVWLASQQPSLAEVLAAGKLVRIARNHQMVEPDEVFAAGDEVAFFPPVTGG